MRFGVHPVRYTGESSRGSIPATLREIATTAEDLGFDWFVLSDQWFQMEMVGAVDDPTPGGLGRGTFRARFGRPRAE